jgi:hypothetical protein
MIINKGEDGARSPGADMDDLRLAFPPGAEPPFRTPVSVLVATAARRGRRRRIATLSAKAALFAVPVIAAVVVFANFSTGTVTPTVRPASSPSAAPSQPAAVCTGAQLSGKVSHAGSQSSAPFAEIVLTNRGPGSLPRDVTDPSHFFDGRVWNAVSTNGGHERSRLQSSR